MVRRDDPTILMVDDDPGDVRIVQEAFKTSRISPNLLVCKDGEDGIEYLKDASNPAPDLILLDLNMPRRDGFEVLEVIKQDDSLMEIPVVVFSTSNNHDDIKKSYQNYANAFVSKPVGLDEFIRAVHEIEDFWFEVAKTP